MKFNDLKKNTETYINEIIELSINNRLPIANLVRERNMIFSVNENRDNKKKLNVIRKMAKKGLKTKNINPELLAKNINTVINQKKEKKEMFGFKIKKAQIENNRAEVELDNIISELGENANKIKSCLEEAKKISHKDPRYKKLELKYDILLGEQNSKNIELKYYLEICKRNSTTDIINSRLQTIKRCNVFQKCSFSEAQYKIEQMSNLEDAFNAESAGWNDLQDKALISNGELDQDSALNRALEIEFGEEASVETNKKNNIHSVSLNDEIAIDSNK